MFGDVLLKACGESLKSERGPTSVKEQAIHLTLLGRVRVVVPTRHLHLNEQIPQELNR